MSVMKRVSKLLAIGIVLSTVSFTTIHARPSVRLEINGKPQTLKNPFLMENGRAFLPVREFGELLGFQIVYDKGLISITSNPLEEANADQKHKKSLTYSNLVDLASQEEVREAMESAGILSENIDSFFGEVNDFNNIVEGKSLVEKGFATIESLEPDYDLVAMMEMWDAQYPEFIGYNCRMTSYDLMKDVINIAKPDTSNSDFLVFDMNALEYSPKEIFNQTEQEDFQTLFSFIPTEDTKDILLHVESVKEGWKNKEITFSNEDKRSIISVLFHDEDGYLFIGHMGVVIPREDGKLLFIEKLSFHQPYQAIKFESRIDLNDYLMNKYDISWDQPTAKPFIMENDQLLEGYRESLSNRE